MNLEPHILVVDDDDAIRALLQTVLRRRGFHVAVARNGVEALEQLSAYHYSLVVLDLQMPVSSGYDVLEQLSAESVMTRPRVLVLSAGAEARDFDSDLVIGTVHKPFDIELLVDIVTGYLSVSKSTSQLRRDAPTASASAPN